MLSCKFVRAGAGIALAVALAGCSSKAGADSKGYDANLMQTDPGQAMAKMAAKTAVGYEIVKTDTAARSLVVRDGVTGELGVLTFDPAAKEMVFQKDSPPASIAPQGAPSWMPLYPHTAPEKTGTNGAETTYLFHSKDSPAKIIQYYSDALKTAGFTIDMISTNISDGGFVTASDAGKTRSVSINVSANNPITNTAITVTEKK